VILKVRVVVEYKFKKLGVLAKSPLGFEWRTRIYSYPYQPSTKHAIAICFHYIRNSIISEAVIYLSRDVCEFSADDYCSGCHCHSNCVVAASGVIVLTKHMFMGSLPIHYLDCSENDS